MNKRENHWYIAGTVAETLGNRKRPRPQHYALALGLTVAVLAFVAVAGQPGLLEGPLQGLNPAILIPVFTAILLAVVIAVARRRGVAQQASFRAAYAKALQSPTPAELVELVDRSMASTGALPDADVLVAQARAVAYALYGWEREATQALAAVNWQAKAPIIQGVGLSAEAAIELLCGRDARRALELSRRARALTAVHAGVPGAGQNENYYNTFVALTEALLNIEAPEAIQLLQVSAADARFPAFQLMSSLGLAAALEHAGHAERAAQVREFIQKTAPHCPPLQLLPSQFAGREGVADGSGPVSGALNAAVPTGAPQELAAKGKISKLMWAQLRLWILMLFMLLVIFYFLARPR